MMLVYANELEKRGHKARVYLLGRNFIRRFLTNFFCFGYPGWVKNFYPKIIKVPSLEEKFIDEADITIFTSYIHAKPISTWPESTGVKFYLIQHYESLYHGPKEEVDKTYLFPFRKIVVSSWLKDIMETKFGGSVELLLNPIDRKQFSPTGRTIDKESIRLLLLHHDYEWKGTKEGVEIVQELKKKYGNLKLILFGARGKTIDFPHDEYYYDLPQEKLSWLYSNSDIFLCPSWEEGFGLPSLEAMACRCAVVTYDNAGSRDFAFDGKTAFVAKRRDITDLKNKLELAIKDENLRKKIAENGYQFALKWPTPEEQAEKLEKIFYASL